MKADGAALRPLHYKIYAVPIVLSLPSLVPHCSFAYNLPLRQSQNTFYSSEPHSSARDGSILSSYKEVRSTRFRLESLDRRHGKPECAYRVDSVFSKIILTSNAITTAIQSNKAANEVGTNVGAPSLNEMDHVVEHTRDSGVKVRSLSMRTDSLTIMTAEKKLKFLMQLKVRSFLRPLER